MSRESWTDWKERILAKSQRGAGNGLTLVDHTHEVVEKAVEILRNRRQAGRFFPVGVSLERVLFWAAVLHDVGKASRSFQIEIQHAIRGLAGARGRIPFETYSQHRHEVLSLAFMPVIAEFLSPPERDLVACAVCFHHKDLKEITLRYPLPGPDEDDPLADLSSQFTPTDVEMVVYFLRIVAPAWANEFGLGEVCVAKSAERKLGCATDEFDLVKAARKELARATSLICSLERGDKEDYLAPITMTVGLLQDADRLASAGAGNLESLSIAGFKDKLAARDVLYEHQISAAATKGSAILISPTGSGKTESALLWAELNAGEGGHKLFYVLPFQASMNAMYDRLSSAWPGKVGLLHGKSLEALYYRLDEDSWRARFSQNMASLRYYPIQVLSPYQILKAVFMLKGYESMIADFSDALFVFDEIHAYEPCRMALVLRFAGYLARNYGSKFFVMSATLPGMLMERLNATLNPSFIIQASPELYARFKRHTVYLLEGEIKDEPVFKRICSDFSDGKKVLVVCNTVRRAQEVYSRLKDVFPRSSVRLLHSRFCSRDRQEIEREVSESCGLDSKSKAPVLLISTQVVEVSLNVDFDVLYSEPAPLEALVQRFGRVNRRGRLGSRAPVYVCDSPVDGQGIYEPGLVEAAVRLFRQTDGTVDVEERLVQQWLDEVYQGELLSKWTEAYDKTSREFESTFLSTLRPCCYDKEMSKTFDRLFDGAEVLPEPLRKEYQEICQEFSEDKMEGTIRGSAFLVPMSYRQLSVLKAHGLAKYDEHLELWVVYGTYDRYLGFSPPAF